MSAPDGIGARRPWRTAGFVLFGIAAASALTGMLVLATGDEQNPQASAGGRPAISPEPGRGPVFPPLVPLSPAPSSSPALLPPPSSSPAPASAPGAPAPGGPAPGPAAAAPATPVPAPAPPGAGPTASPEDKRQSRGEVRIYNNSTIRGLAARAANDLTAAGWTVVGVGNYSGGRIWTTTVYYQDADDQRAIAQAVGTEFAMRVEPRFAGIAGADPGVIIIVTNDYRS